ncbi:uncharacterized protein LOC135495973 [Lineus longissimus]|uniref:uncharacterized protein LOC135495973 n=1 Tax=Lineus longissimus TaxID=88925 RepID=UPI002B4D1AD0
MAANLCFFILVALMSLLACEANEWKVSENNAILVKCPYSDRPACTKLYCSVKSQFGILMLCPQYQPDICKERQLVNDGCVVTGVQKMNGEYPNCCPIFKKVCKGDKYFSEAEFKEVELRTRNDNTKC